MKNLKDSLLGTNFWVNLLLLVGSLWGLQEPTATSVVVAIFGLVGAFFTVRNFLVSAKFVGFKAWATDTNTLSTLGTVIVALIPTAGPLIPAIGDLTKAFVSGNWASIITAGLSLLSIVYYLFIKNNTAKLPGAAGVILLVVGTSIGVTACTNTAPTQNDTNTHFCKTISTLPTVSTGVNDRAMGYVNKWWPQKSELKIGFPWGGTDAQKQMVKLAFEQWKRTPVNLSFSYPAIGPYDIRVAFNENDGAWSYVGIDCKNIPESEPTMNIGWVEQAANDHEVGHALGLLHEHQNPSKAICWNQAQVVKDLSGPPNNWNLETIQFNVLTPYTVGQVITTEHDAFSIMHYPIPSSWTCDNQAIPGGAVISPADRAFIAARYPTGTTTPPDPAKVCITKAQAANIVRLQARSRLYADSVISVTRKAFNL